MDHSSLLGFFLFSFGELRRLWQVEPEGNWELGKFINTLSDVRRISLAVGFNPSNTKSLGTGSPINRPALHEFDTIARMKA